MESALLDLIHAYGFIFLAVVGACWITARIGMFIINALLWLAECLARQDEDDRRTFL